MEILLQRLRDAGLAVDSVTPAGGGVVAHAAVVTLVDGRRLFAKTLADPAPGVFEVEAEGLRALRDIGGATTPGIRMVAPNLLVLDLMRSSGTGDGFWERLGRMVAVLHTTTSNDRFGWHRDGWLGRMRQHNTWDTDGYAFFAERRILRWLPEPLVESAFDAAERRALERLCAALPDLVPPQPAVLTHGDLWWGNVLADAGGGPVLIDPAVSYTWPEVDLSMMWCTPRPAGGDRFFGAYAEAAPLLSGWRERMPVLFLRELMSIIAHGDDDWGAVAYVRRLIAPFR
jgi:fructosamine-3-kinase